MTQSLELSRLIPRELSVELYRIGLSQQTSFHLGKPNLTPDRGQVP